MEHQNYNENEIEKVIIEHKGYKNQIVTIEDIPEGTMQLIAELCGLPVAVSLMQNAKGLVVAVPSNGFEKIEKKIILQEYDGSTEKMRRLALRLDLNEKTVRKILNDFRLEVSDGQLHLFEKGWQNNVKNS